MTKIIKKSERKEENNKNVQLKIKKSLVKVNHLKILKDCSLVETRKQGTLVYYYLHTERDFSPVKRLISMLEDLIHNIEKSPANATTSKITEK